MKKLLFLAFLSAPALGMAQTANEIAVAEMATATLSGNVDYIDGSGSVFNVNYSFAPVNPASFVIVSLSTADPVNLSVKIINGENVAVKSWTPSEISDIYEQEIDVSDLPAGSYNYLVYWNTNIVKAIPFTKE